VPRLLKRSIGVPFGVLRGPRSDAPLPPPLFLASYGFCIVVMSTCFRFAVLRGSVSDVRSHSLHKFIKNVIIFHHRFLVLRVSRFLVCSNSELISEAMDPLQIWQDSLDA
jgi:hypothetical protein